MVSAGLGLLALLALSAGVWGQPINSVTDVDLPPSACENDNDCGGSDKGRCISNWPQRIYPEEVELAELLLPNFDPSAHWAVCWCKRLTNGRMPKGPRCDPDVVNIDASCNSDEQCGGAEDGGRCLFREDNYGYCVCRKGRQGNKCEESVNSERIGEQQYLGPYYPGGGFYGGYPNLAGYGSYAGAYGLGYQAPFYNGYYGTGAYGLGYQVPYYNGFYGNNAYRYGNSVPPYYGYYGNGARYGLGYQVPFNSAYQYGLGYQAPYYGNLYQAYQPYTFNGINQPYYGTGYQLPFYGGIANYGLGYTGYNYGAQLYPRTTYYQNYQLPAYQLPAFRPATTYYQPYISTGGYPWSLYALTYSTGQPSFYGASYSGYFGYGGYGYGAGYPYGYGYNVGYASPYNYGYNYGLALPRYNYGYNYGASFLPYNYGVGYSPYYNYGYNPVGLGYSLGASLLTNPYAYRTYPNLGYQAPAYYGGYYGAGIFGYPYQIGGAIPGYGTPYYTGVMTQPAYSLPGVAPYSFYNGFYGGMPGAAFPAGFSPAAGFTGYRPGAVAYPYADPRIGFSAAPGTTQTPAAVQAPLATTAAYGPYVGGYGLGFATAPYASYGGFPYGYGTGRMLRFNKLSGTYLPTNVPYGAALGGVGGAIGASPVPGAAIASGGTSLIANEGKAGGWEPSLMPEMCDPSYPSGGFCQNGGVCQNNFPFGVTCSCPPDWMGRACETEKGGRGAFQVQTPYSFGCGCPIAVNGPNGQVVTPAGQALAPGSCINPCVMTAIDRLRFMNGNGGGNPAFNSNNQPDLFPSVEGGPASFLQCGDRNHPAGNCHVKPCAPGTIFSFGAQVCTADDTGINTPVIAAGTPIGNAFVGNAFVGGGVYGGGYPTIGAAIPFKKK